uniref:hAT-like transposase RNase-H fold domain-containing protein n=1 Tax=Brassica oleracea var. oleracea TaxID=109376 RepID=A0A0D3AG90_BRAOL
MKNINMMLIVATVFDPSNKLELAKLCFEELYGLDTVDYKEMYESLMCLLRSLFKEYSSRHGPRVDPSDQSSQSDQSTQPRDQSIERMEVVDDFVGYKRMDVRYKQKLNEIG